jgi:hypothetical protein
MDTQGLKDKGFVQYKDVCLRHYSSGIKSSYYPYTLILILPILSLCMLLMYGSSQSARSSHEQEQIVAAINDSRRYVRSGIGVHLCSNWLVA